jgi:hypothetical protein
LKGRVIEGELVELEPEANVLAAGFDLGLGHKWALKLSIKPLPSLLSP